MLTVNDTYKNQIELDKSKFLAILFPLNDDNLFKEILKNYKKEYSKAKHIVYAYRVGNKSKSNDDGEPKGTAGRPLLELLYKKDLNNVALIVIRHFGGTKLGASRLLRTYLNSGIEVIKIAKLIEME